MISTRHFRRPTRRSILLSAVCVLVVAASVLGMRLARKAETRPPKVPAAAYASDKEAAPTAAQGGARIRTDRKVYPKPPLPRLPRAGGTYTDPVFGTLIMRATDETLSAPRPAAGLTTRTGPLSTPTTPSSSSAEGRLATRSSSRSTR